MTVVHERQLNELIPYRMKAIDTFKLAVQLKEELGHKERRMEIFFDGQLCIEGNFHGWANAAIESGILHCRALLEFLGLKADHHDPTKLKQRSGKEPDDVAIEDFCKPDGTQLTKITIKEALSKYEGPNDEAEHALATVIRQGNKGLAHMTSVNFNDPDLLRFGLIASAGVPSLLINYLYKPLGRPGPTYEITKRRRDAA